MPSSGCGWIPHFFDFVDISCGYNHDIRCNPIIYLEEDGELHTFYLDSCCNLYCTLRYKMFPLLHTRFSHAVIRLSFLIFPCKGIKKGKLYNMSQQVLQDDILSIPDIREFQKCGYPPHNINSRQRY